MFQVREWTLIILDTRAKGILKSSWKSLGKGACIKYAGAGGTGEGGGGEGEEFYKFFKKKFVAQETIHLNISRPSNFFGKYFMTLPINFSFLFKAYL